MEEVATANSTVGTRMYFSPELITNTPYNKASDVFALGLILYEMCTYKCFLTPEIQKTIQLGEGIVIPDLGPQYKNAQRILEDVLQLDSEDRHSVRHIIKSIDRVYPDLKPQSITKSQTKDSKIEEMERKMREMEAKL